MSTHSLEVNGTLHTVDVPPDMPLLWVLRDILVLTGTKFGCGRGLCGSCTVLLDGKPTRSCRLPLSRVGDRRVTTIEGLAVDGLHPVQSTWLDEQVVQCGVCQPGMILSASALLEEDSKPSDEKINEALGKHICRCGTYNRARRAIRRAAEEGGK